MFNPTILLLIALSSYIIAIPPPLRALSLSRLSKRYLVKCWERSYSSSSPWSSFAPIIDSDCLKAALDVACSDDMFQPVYFSRNADSAMRLPLVWINGTCKVKMDITAPGSPIETTSLFEIQNRVLEITRKCVMSKSQRQLGGYSTVGKRDLIQLSVSGNVVAPDPDAFLADLTATDVCQALR